MSAAAPPAASATALIAGRRRVRVVATVVLVASVSFALGAAPALVALGRFQNLLLHGRASDPVCSFRQRTGVPCLGCGGTRALRLAAHGELRGAWRTNPLGAWAAVVAWLTALGGAMSVFTGNGTWLRRAAWVTAASAVPAFVSTCVWWWHALPPGPLGP